MGFKLSLLVRDLPHLKEVMGPSITSFKAQKQQLYRL